MKIHKTDICHHCPAFICSTTIVDVDNDMNITELYKMGECSKGMPQPPLCHLFQAIENTIQIIADMINPLLKLLMPLINKEIEKQFKTVKAVEIRTKQIKPPKCTGANRQRQHRIQHKGK